MRSSTSQARRRGLRAALTTALAGGALLVPMTGGESGASKGQRTARTAAPASLDTPERATQPRVRAPFRPRFPLFHRRQPGAPRSPGPTPSSAPNGTIELVFTFDDGPNLGTTPLVMDTLARHDVKAIFFVSGHMLVGNRPEDRARRNLVRKLAARGHMVANHTINHKDLCAEPTALEAEIDGNAEILTAATGVRPLLFRSPYGARCQALSQALAARELLNIGWNVDPQEWRARDPESIARAVIEQISALPGRGIVLLHDTKRATVRALPLIFDWIERQNLRAARGRARPIRVVDYSVFLPPRPLPAVGIEPVLARIGRFARALPGLHALGPLTAGPLADFTN